MYRYYVRLLRLYQNCNVNLRLLEYNGFHRDSLRNINTFSQYDEKDKYAEIASTVSNYFNLDIDTSKQIIQSSEKLTDYKLMNIQKSLETCSNFNIDKTVLKNNLWLLKIKPGTYKACLKMYLFIYFL